MSIAPKKYKIARRLGAGVFEKTQSQKFMLAQAKRSKTGKRPKRPTDFGLQLIEKQKVRTVYGLREKQFRGYVDKAMQHANSVAPATMLFRLLERRLDNVAYRLGLVTTRGAARQLASHGHLLVNGTRTTVPSYQLKDGDVISIRSGSKDSAMFTELAQRMKGASLPKWLNWDASKMEGQIKGDPKDPDAFLDFQSVLEFYSR